MRFVERRPFRCLISILMWIYDFAQIRSLNNVLLQNLFDAPALVICGTTGSGKSAICTSLLEQLSVPHATVQCAGFGNSKQFYASMWAAVKRGVDVYKQDVLRKYGATLAVDDSLQWKSTNKLSDFTLVLGKLMHMFFNATTSKETVNAMTAVSDGDGVMNYRSGHCFYLLIDGIDNTAHLDFGMANNLLNLTQVGENDRFSYIEY